MADRLRSSTVISEEYVGGQAPRPNVRYVEVPVVEEVIRHVPVKQVIEVEKIVPKYEYEYVDRIVEIPQIQYVDRQVEVPQIIEVVRHIPRREVVEVPKEVIRHVPRVETVVVEKVVEVPGQIIEVPKPYTVENKIPVPRFIDNEVQTVVAQIVQPVVVETDEHEDVDVYHYEPEIRVVDVIVPKLMPTAIRARGVVSESSRVVTVPSAQFNTIMKQMNRHLDDRQDFLPYVRDASGAVNMVDGLCMPHALPVSMHARQVLSPAPQMGTPAPTPAPMLSPASPPASEFHRDRLSVPVQEYTHDAHSKCNSGSLYDVASPTQRTTRSRHVHRHGRNYRH